MYFIIIYARKGGKEIYHFVGDNFHQFVCFKRRNLTLKLEQRCWMMTILKFEEVHFVSVGFDDDILTRL